MPYYDVEYIHVVEIKYIAKTFADTPTEAKQNIVDGVFISEEEVDMQGLEIIPKRVKLSEEN